MTTTTTARLLTGIAGITVAVGLLTGCSHTTGGAPTADTAGYAPTITTNATPVDTGYTPQPEDFAIHLIVTGKQCFGPESCVYTYDIDADYIKAIEPRPFKTITVVYTITGGSQDAIDNFVIDKDWNVSYDTNMKAIGPDGAILGATVTRVIVKD